MNALSGLQSPQIQLIVVCLFVGLKSVARQAIAPDL